MTPTAASDGVICLCADRLARAYAYQVLILEELERFGVSVQFLEGPAHGEDPQATLLVQMQGVIAEYDRAKIAERYRRGKLYAPAPARSRSGRPHTATAAWRRPTMVSADRDLRARGGDRARDLLSLRREGPLGAADRARPARPRDSLTDR